MRTDDHHEDDETAAKRPGASPPAIGFVIFSPEGRTAISVPCKGPGGRGGRRAGPRGVYILKPGVKTDPHRRWSLPDRVFFGHGACHILAGAYLDRPPLPGFYAERIIPAGQHPGAHVFVTDGVIAFDHHGYSVRDRLLEHHRRVWSSRHDNWLCAVERVDFCLLSTPALNARKMLGPEQYLHHALPRARRFINGRDHGRGAERARAGLPGA